MLQILEFLPGCQASLRTAVIHARRLPSFLGNGNIFIFDNLFVPEVRLHPTAQQPEPNFTLLMTLILTAFVVGAILPENVRDITDKQTQTGS